jgi:hypothetical protein
MPVEGINGILNVESAALHAPQVGIANTNPQHILSVGSNLYVSGDSSDVLTVDGNVVCEGVKVGLIEIIPSYDLEAVANVGNSTSNTIQFTNPDTGIVTTGNVSVGKTLTVTGNLNVLGTTTTIDTENLRVKDPIIELGKDNDGSLVDLGLVMTRPSGSSNVAVIFDEFTDTLEIGYTQSNASDTDIAMRTAAIEPLSVNVNGNLSVTSNVEVGTANLFVDTTTGNVGIGKTDPGSALDVVGDVDIVGTVTTTNLIRGVVEEAVRWNSQNETVFPQSASTRYYKIATLGTTGGGANGGKLRISGTIGGFGEDETTLIDGFVASRQSIRFGGTLTGYGSDNPSDVDFVVYEESDGTFAVWLKVIRYFVFDFTIMGAQVSNNTRTLAVLPCPTSDTSVTTPTGTLQGSVVDSCSVVFTDDGNVGIGTNTPNSLLTFNRTYPTPANGSQPAADDIQGITFRSNLSSFAGSPAPAWDSSVNVDVAKIWFQPKSYQGISGSAGAHGLLCLGTGYFGSQSSTADMVINTEGKVGIGTNNPLYKLQVTGTGCLSGIWANPANEADSRHWITSAQHDITPTEFTNSTADGRLNIQDKASVFIRFILGTPNTSENLKGAITQSGSNTLYTATSDYRLKTNIKPFTNGLEIINSLKPVYYTFNVEPYDDCSGFIAHELQEIIPQCVAGKKDEVDKHGNMIPQSVDKSYIVTHLVSALQQVHKELQTEKTRNDTLETQLTSVLARLDALESA